MNKIGNGLAVILILCLAGPALGGGGFSLRTSAEAPSPLLPAEPGSPGFALASSGAARDTVSPLAFLSLPAAYAIAESEAASVKRPWRAALEVFSIDLANWALDRYLLNRSYARVGFSTWRYNLEHGFIFDPDTFGMNFFAHPFSGSLYFNAARSMGLDFWASTPYALGGSFLWEMFAETQQPSVNDLVMTTTGGILLGEIQFRLSSLILDDTDTGWTRAGRETLAFLIDPVRGLNRLLFGDAFRRQGVNRQLRTAFHGSFGYRGYFVTESTRLTGLTFSPGLEFEFMLGESTPFNPARAPFDLVFFDLALRHGRQKLAFSVNSYALLVGHEVFNVSGQRTLLGLFQNFDYISNEIVSVGGSSFALGMDSSYPFGSGFTVRMVAQLGAVVFGASNNKYTLIEERDYNYGIGPVAKVDLWLSQPRLGRLLLRWGHYQLYTFRATALAGVDSHDFLTFVSAKYGLTFWRKLGLRIEYVLFKRHLQFEGRPAYDSNLTQLGAALVVFF